MIFYKKFSDIYMNMVHFDTLIFREIYLYYSLFISLFVYYEEYCINELSSKECIYSHNTLSRFNDMRITDEPK